MSGPARRKRVLLFSPFAAVGGGAERVLLDHARFLDRDRFEPFGAVVAEGSFAEALRALGIETHVCAPHSERNPLAMARELFRFGKFVQEKRIDAVVGNKYRSISYWALSQARTRKFVWLLHDPPIDTGFFRRSMALLVERVKPSAIVWVTPESRELFGERFPHLTTLPSSEIRPGTCPEDLMAGADAGRARALYGIPEHAPVLSVFARLQPSKGHLDLIQAAPAILARHPETRILLCGGSMPGMPSDHERAVAAAIHERSLEQRVLLLGMISESAKKDVLALTSVLVHPARWEPFGIAVIEGMGVGKPVVVADARGPSYIVEHERTGLIVPKEQPAALAEAVIGLLDDEPRARGFGRAAAERVRERFHARVAADELGRIIDGLTR